MRLGWLIVNGDVLFANEVDADRARAVTVPVEFASFSTRMVETPLSRIRGRARRESHDRRGVTLGPAAGAYRKKVAELQAALTVDEQERREAMGARSSAVSESSRWRVAVRSNCTSVARGLNFRAAMVVAEARYTATPTLERTLFCYWRAA
jgi:hypothetical protein